MKSFIQSFGCYDSDSERNRILIYGGIKSNYREINVFNLDFLEYNKTSISVPESLKDKFFYNNYSYMDQGKKIIVLGRDFIHCIDLEYPSRGTKSIGEGYKKFLKT